MRAYLIPLLACTAAAQMVTVKVDATRSLGPARPVWRYFGHDEPNYTYMKDGRKLLSELAALGPDPVYMRVHNLLTTGDGTPALKWGSTNAYTEDASGNPHYDWTIIDRIFDSYVQRGMKPLVEIGFMPEALSVKPEPYRHHWDQAVKDSPLFTGWAYPPRDYAKWSELVYQWVRHSAERYGKAEVQTWLWEVWNEPDIGYWQSTPEEYYKLYDYSAEAVRRALPEAQVGGPASTGPGSEKAAAFLRGFLEHVTRGKNFATGKTGSPLDFISFHAKGRPRVVGSHVQMGSEYQLRDIDAGFSIVASFPNLKNLPIIIGECDPEGCAACSVRYNPQNAYRNGTMYSSYTAAIFSRLHELAARRRVNLEGALTWAFEFEGQPYFAGFRDLATNGIDKPVLNVFRMFGMMGGDIVQASSSGQIALDRMLADGVKGDPDIGVFATRGARQIAVMLWNYHDEDLPAPPARIDLAVSGVPATRVLLQDYAVDAAHSNSYEVWRKMGSPQPPDERQYARLERAGQLELAGSPQWRNSNGGETHITLDLPRQDVRLLILTW